MAVDPDSVHRIKPIPPRRTEALELEEIAAAGWPAPETHWLGRWLLRAAAGWTGRANSVLPLGDPGRPLDLAVETVRRWYADRGLGARFQVPLPVATGLDDDLADRGFRADPPVLVQTAVPARVLADTEESPGLPPVTLAGTPTRGWLAAYHYRGGSSLPPVAVEVMTAAELPVFASVVHDGETVAVARAVVDDGWLGVTAVEVAPAWQRRGLASHVMRGLAPLGRRERGDPVLSAGRVGQSRRRRLLRAAGLHHPPPLPLPDRGLSRRPQRPKLRYLPR